MDDISRDRTAKPEAYPKLARDACGGLRQRTNQKTAIARLNQRLIPSVGAIFQFMLAGHRTLQITSRFNLINNSDG
ncbi:hypothetical protein QUB63_30920 [Microcoleus sp. ARI1-B5]|uniref:hypothetical protein n=1 Tax=unclassified Microcoleus TaxID=2642155 RepID=UPI002FD23A17